MTPKPGAVLNAAVLEVMPERKCSDCGEPLPKSVATSLHSFKDKGGAVVLFWCDTCGAGEGSISTGAPDAADDVLALVSVQSKAEA